MMNTVHNKEKHTMTTKWIVAAGAAAVLTLGFSTGIAAAEADDAPNPPTTSIPRDDVHERAHEKMMNSQMMNGHTNSQMKSQMMNGHMKHGDMMSGEMMSGEMMSGEMMSGDRPQNLPTVPVGPPEG
jgi:hypothetical protein